MKKIDFLTGGQPIRQNDFQRIQEYSESLEKIINNSITDVNSLETDDKCFLVNSQNTTDANGEDVIFTKTGSGTFTYTILNNNFLLYNTSISDSNEKNIYEIVGGNSFTGTTIDDAKIYILDTYDSGGTITFYDLATKDVWPSKYAYIMGSSETPPSGSTYLDTYNNIRFVDQKNIVCNNITVDGSASIGDFNDSIVPSTNNTYDIGSSSSSWKDLYVSGTSYLTDVDFGGDLEVNGDSTFIGNIKSDLLPNSTNTYDLGSSSLKWKELFVFDIDISGKIDGSLIPNDDDIHDLGSATYQWRDGYFDGTINCDGIDVVGTTTIDALTISGRIDGSLLPDDDDIHDLGSSTYQWRDAYFDGVLRADGIQNGGYLSMGGDLYPTSNNAYEFGTSSSRWQKGWFVNGDTTNAFNVSSDERLKKDIENIESTTDKLMSLRPIKYNWIDDNMGKLDNDEKYVGIVAQELELIFPGLVHTTSTDLYEDQKSINNTGLIPYLIKGFQEQQVLIESLKEEIEKLK